ncbi:AraC family transcriptional regulator [Phenylobacterium sp.]|uniref:AraC family transcriptional regulator n=1 Tax=Phenylobacterium sp. TaxID=1871053 RepID=UPI0025ED3F8F|nr:AraC family transcriptional regulator [Phenylobacterium sp.]
MTVPFTLSNDVSENFEHWREEWMRPVLGADVEAPDPARYRSWLRVLRLPKVSVIESRCTPSVLRRTRRLVRDGDEGLVVVLPWRGTLEYRVGDKQGRLEAGQAMMLPLDEPNSLVAREGVHGVSLRFDRESGRDGVFAAEHDLRRPAPVAAVASRLLRGYLSSMLAIDEGLTPALSQVADRHLQELLANAFNPWGELARAAPYGGIRAARLQAIVQEIAAGLADPELSAASVGRRLGVSERYVQQLMEGAGVSFSTFVRHRRLDRARELLRDPTHAHLRIVEIAGLAGLGDVSHFNREFRRRFGEAPRDARRRGL